MYVSQRVRFTKDFTPKITIKIHSNLGRNFISKTDPWFFSVRTFVNKDLKFSLQLT